MMKKEFIAFIFAVMIFGNSGCKKDNVVTPPSWNLSGKIIFNVGYSGIYVIDMSSPLLSLATLVSGGEPGEPRINPQGTKIVYDAISPKGAGDIYVLNISDGSVTDLTNNSVPNSDSWPDWSPDGSLIVFNRVYYPSFKEAVCVMNSDGSNLHALTDTTSLAIAVMPRWSPDGSKIAFLGQVSFNPPSDYSLYVTDYDGAHQVLLDKIGPTFVDVLPHWSPDSYQLAYGKYYQSFSDTTTGGLFLMDIVTKTSKRISFGGKPSPFGFSWLSNDKFIGISENLSDTTYQVYLISVTTSSNDKLLAEKFKSIPTTGVSPDGKFVSIFGQRGDDATLTLYVVQSDETNFRKLRDTGLTGQITDYYYSQWIE